MNTAPVKWAQRKDSVYVTINLADVKDHKVELTDRKLIFQGNSGDKPYKLDLEFFKEIEAEGSIWNVLPASVQMKLMKKEKEEEFWPRLLLDKVQEKTNVKVDWDKYVDEDEADGREFDTGALDGGMDFGGMGGGGMGGGMGGMDFSQMMGGMGGGMGGDTGGMNFGDDEGDDEGPGGAGGDSDDDADLPDLESS